MTAAWLVALPCNQAWACSCEQSTDAEVYDGATAVFTGTAVRVSGDDPAIWTFSTDSVDKGHVADEQAVSLPGYVAACGFTFRVGERYQVFAYEADGRLYTDHCSGNRHVSGGAEPFDRDRPETESRPNAVVPSAAPAPPAPAPLSVAPSREQAVAQGAGAPSPSPATTGGVPRDDLLSPLVLTVAVASAAAVTLAAWIRTRRRNRGPRS